MDDISGDFDGNFFKFSITFIRYDEKDFMFLDFRGCKDKKGKYSRNEYLLGELDMV